MLVNGNCMWKSLYCSFPVAPFEWHRINRFEELLLKLDWTKKNILCTGIKMLLQLGMVWAQYLVNACEIWSALWAALMFCAVRGLLPTVVTGFCAALLWVCVEFSLIYYDYWPMNLILPLIFTLISGDTVVTITRRELIVVACLPTQFPYFSTYHFYLMLLDVIMAGKLCYCPSFWIFWLLKN